MSSKNSGGVFSKIILLHLKKLLKLDKNSFGLVVGLGNYKSTPDSLGPKVIKEEFRSIYNVEELVNYTFNNNNEIESVLINSAKVNDIIYIASSLISQAIKEGIIEKELEEISFPIGQLISKSIFAGEGPDIHIEVDPITSYEVDIETNMKEYGINNSIIEVILDVEIEYQIMLAFEKETHKSNKKIIIESKIIQGKIPNYYNYTNSLLKENQMI